MNRIESSKKTFEPIGIKKQIYSTDWKEEQMNNSYLEIDMDWKWN